MSIFQLTQTIQIVPSLPARSGKRPSQPVLPGMEPEAEVSPKVSNRQIAEVLSGIADLLESQAGNPYRIQAYRNAARGILDLAEPAADILARGEALPIPGLGDRLRTRIRELVEKGVMTFHNGLCLPALPTGVRALLNVEHVGPYTAIRLYEELGIDSVEKLWWAAQQQRIRQLSGFGARSEARLKEAAQKALGGPKKQQSLNEIA
ncbi:DNA polymerase (family 10) [Thermosporothrix hazakensis]|uniref:DNA polymerase (Family 10) n=2 Tax=Thermosporothrix TaxID=768650 RepID=A0A326U7J4_THEHA|nr:helix-hairpin-helix domain-containing protein [Thermosporothrix hazakensis]PZW30677.1 DNA polymerase (family 10) [Thermosporothrix hazakensis]